jgi:mRNA-degrading endonuclease RelE of RelBE toxin-antitoxin system
MNKKHFIRELLSLPHKFNNQHSKEEQQSVEFQSNIIEGFAENLPKEIKDEIHNTQVKDEDYVKMFDKMSPEDQDQFVSFFETLIDNISDQDPMHHKGYTFNPTDIYNKYHKLKSKYDAYQDSEDINNF